MGTLGADGGYNSSQEYNREKVVLAHTWRTNIGTLDSSISNTQTETVGRLIPARAQNLSKTVTPRLLESEDTIFDTKFTTQHFSGHNITLRRSMVGYKH